MNSAGRNAEHDATEMRSGKRSNFEYLRCLLILAFDFCLVRFPFLRNFKLASRPLFAVARAPGAHRENLCLGFSLCPLCAQVSVANGREKDFF